MPFSQIGDAMYPLTGDGNAAGYVTIDPASDLLPGTTVNLYSPGAGSLECLVLDFKSDGKVYLRAKPTTMNDPRRVSYGYTDVSAWTVVGGAKLFVERQIVQVDNLYRPKPAF